MWFRHSPGRHGVKHLLTEKAEGAYSLNEREKATQRKREGPQRDASRNSNQQVKVALLAVMCLFLHPASTNALCRLTTFYVIEATVSACNDVESLTRRKFTLDRYSFQKRSRIARLYVKEKNPEPPESRLIEVGDMEAQFREFLDDNDGHIVNLVVHRSVGLLYQRDSVGPGAHVLWRDSVGESYGMKTDIYLLKTAGLDPGFEVTAFAASETELCGTIAPVTRLLELDEPCCDLVPTGKAACLLGLWETRGVSPETKKMLADTEDWIREEDTED